MITRFVFTGLRASPRPRYPHQVVGSVPCGAPTHINPLQPLLNSLRGRVIGVMTAEREVEGRLVLADPVTLTGTNGIPTLVALDRVLSVRF